MPTVKNKITGEVVAQLGYDQAGENTANEMAANDPLLSVDYGENADFSPGGISNAQDRMVNSPFQSNADGTPGLINPPGLPNANPDISPIPNPSLMGYNKGGKVKK